MAFLVEQGPDAVHIEPFRREHHARTEKLEIKAVQKLAKACLERETNKKKRNGGLELPERE